jgi:hypothetical protein
MQCAAGAHLCGEDAVQHEIRSCVQIMQNVWAVRWQGNGVASQQHALPQAGLTRGGAMSWQHACTMALLAARVPAAGTAAAAPT